MRPLLLSLLCAAAWAQNAQQQQQQAQASVAQTVSAALPQGTPVPQGGDLSRFLRGLPPDQQQAALTALTNANGSFAQDPASQSVLATSYMDLGDPTHALSAANAALAADPQNGDALAAKARALQASNDVRGALAAYRAIPPSSPQYAVAVSQVKLLGQGAAGGGFSPAGFAAGSGDGGAFTTGNAALDHRMLLAWNRGAQSQTFNNAAQRANAPTLADLQAAGISIEVGPPDMKGSVQVVQRDGGQVIQFNPTVVNNTHTSRVAAQLGNGLEQAATNENQDYQGLAGWIRSLGGRVVAVKVYKELEPTDTVPQATDSSDAGLSRDVAMAGRPTSLPGATYTASDIGGQPNGNVAPMMSLVSMTTAAGTDLVDLLVKLTRSAAPQTPPPSGQDNTDLGDLKNRGL